MLKSLTIQNFKGFGESTTIPLAPITLLYGENSAGKSSILQALAILKAVAANGKDARLDILFPEEAEIDTGNVGTFRESITAGDMSRVMSIHVECDNLPVMPKPCRGGNARTEGRDTLKGLVEERQSVVFEVAYGTDGTSTGCMTHVSVKQGSETWSQPEPANKLYEFFSENAPRICSGVDAAIDYECVTRLQGLSQRTVLETPEFLHLRKELRQAKSGHSQVQEFYCRKFKPADFRERISQNRQEWILAYDKRKDALQARLQCQDFKVGEWDKGLEYCADVEGDWAWRRGQSWPSTWMLPFNPMDEHVRENFFALWASMSFLQGMRAKPGRSGSIGKTAPDGVGRDGGKMPDCLYHRGDVCEKVNAWLKDRGLGYWLYQGEKALMVRDERSATHPQITIADVGFGLSQVLPILTQAFMKEHQTIAVQQPEEHIHPRLQAEFGSFVVENANTMGNQFIIETHSEHLMLRIQKLMRKKALKPEHVLVLYVSRSEDGSNVQQLRLNDQGEFLDAWPDGFFPERINEILGD